jgi:hypothetical protein
VEIDELTVRRLRVETLVVPDDLAARSIGPRAFGGKME